MLLRSPFSAALYCEAAVGRFSSRKLPSSGSENAPGIHAEVRRSGFGRGSFELLPDAVAGAILGGGGLILVEYVYPVRVVAESLLRVGLVR